MRARNRQRRPQPSCSFPILLSAGSAARWIQSALRDPAYVLIAGSAARWIQSAPRDPAYVLIAGSAPRWIQSAPRDPAYVRGAGPAERRSHAKADPPGTPP